MNDMVKKVATALARAEGDDSGVTWDCFEYSARAAILAMRDFNADEFTPMEAAAIRSFIDKSLDVST